MTSLKGFGATVVVGLLAACSSGTSTAPNTTAAPASTAAAVVSSTTTAAATSTAPATTVPASTTVATFPPYTSAVYGDSGKWLCRPDGDDVCDRQPSWSALSADGTITAAPPAPTGSKPVDCFYVYPTTSGDATMSSAYVPDGEAQAARFQAAHFSDVCNVYAPMYRSVTLTGLGSALSGGSSEFAMAWGQAYDDVRDAWSHYLANDNNGRKVAIITHSQGGFHAARLLKEMIDPDPVQRKLLLSAFIIGAAVQVPAGKDVGGDLKNIPLCRADNQVGCVVTYASFRAEVPPIKGSIFGAPGADTVAGCTNPAKLSGGKAPLDPMVGKDAAFADPSKAASVSTDIVRASGLVSAECAENDGHHFLSVTVNADPSDPRADTITGDGAANWGLHGVDHFLAYFDLVRIVGAQAAAAK